MGSKHLMTRDTRDIILAFCSVFVQIVIVKIFKYISVGIFAEMAPANGVFDIVLTFVSCACPIIIFLLFGESKNYFSVRQEFKFKSAVIYLLWALGLGYTFRIAFSSVISMLSFFDASAVNGAGAGIAALYFISAAVIPSVLEEIFYRGILIDIFARYRGGLVVTAMLFAISHGNIVSIINAFVFGLLIGYVYKRTRSIYYCIMIHFMNNLIAFMGVITKGGDVLFYVAEYLPYIISICGICFVIIARVSKRDIFQ